ncbi:unnamed protein product [Cylindrotheca closterium]|uniref:Uncharacterized protein n=1 Tax=Cylindrotheca closterium TaxID=2856 RepID=A0AAD2CRI6_9STRA|nr:unnamed protein product [Cylindrotheca closterium]CAJ1950937.1 unnamed protein product [Cylindrotheca closterium]
MSKEDVESLNTPAERVSKSARHAFLLRLMTNCGISQAEVLQDQYGVAWFRNFVVKTKAYAAIASIDTAAQNKFKDDIFEAVLATGFLCNCD